MEGEKVKQGMKVRIGLFRQGWGAMRSAHHTGSVVEVMGQSGKYPGCWTLYFKGVGLMDTYHPDEFEPVG